MAIQCAMKRVRSSRSFTQLDRGLRDGYALDAHISGTYGSVCDKILLVMAVPVAV